MESPDDAPNVAGRRPATLRFQSARETLEHANRMQMTVAARMSPKIAALAAWFVGTAFFGILGGYHIVPQLIYLYDLGKSNLPTLAEVIEVHPELHNTCKYRFSRDERVYEHGGGSCGSSKIGQQIVVYFSPNDPAKSINNNPLASFWNDLIPFILGLTLFPIFAALAAYRGVKKARCHNAIDQSAGVDTSEPP